jgi:SAM-dependent methyltransferase
MPEYVGCQSCRRLFTRRTVEAVRAGQTAPGACPVCAHACLFIREGASLRSHLACARCRSLPRSRALVHVLETHFPAWRDLHIHESSPGGASLGKFMRECRHYLPTHFFPDTPPGETRDGCRCEDTEAQTFQTHAFRCEDLEAQTFADELFDLVITQDVFEHVLDPGRAFAEVARTLKPGGAHVFTIPWYPGQETMVRAVRVNGSVKHLLPPDYHVNPMDDEGSLVVTEWGRDVADFIYRASGLTTTVFWINDRSRGIEGEFREVFVSRKPRKGREK